MREGLITVENENDKPKRGRPKGSKNRPKETNAVDNNVVNIPSDPDEVVVTFDNSYRIANNYMLPVKNLDWDVNKSLLGNVENFGDWDFGILPPFFSKKRVLSEKITHAFVSLFESGKPRHLLLFGRVEIRPNQYSQQLDRSFYFNENEWTDEDVWMEP